MHQIESKKLTNPVLESTQHKQLQQELKLRTKRSAVNWNYNRNYNRNCCRGELRNQRSELDRILFARKRETDSSQRRAESAGFPSDDIKSPHGAMSAELFEQLHKRTVHLQQVYSLP